jgi:hypothetical protein
VASNDRREGIDEETPDEETSVEETSVEDSAFIGGIFSHTGTLAEPHGR